MNRNFILATASLLGTIIGAGMFAIPYIMAKSGVLLGLFYFLLIGVLMIFLHLFFGEIILRTKGKHRIIGYTERYLGKKAKILITITTIVGLVGALLAYVILGGLFLKIIFPGFSVFYFSLIAWAVLSFFVFFGMKTIAPVEVAMNFGLLAVVFVIFYFSVSKINLSNFISVNFQNIFLPFGIIMFSLVGWSAVPEIEGILKNKAVLKKVIIFSIIFAVIFYIIFGLVIVGVTGAATTEEPFNGLQNVLGRKVAILGGIFGLLSVATSFLVLANYLKNSLILDYHLPRFLSFLIASLPPMILFLVGIRGFIGVIGILGIFIGLVDGVIIILMHKKAKQFGDRLPEYSVRFSKIGAYAMITVLSVGVLSQIIYYFV